MNKKRPIIVCIGGSDSAGLAGIQMDTRTAEAMGVHAMAVVTTVTAQTNDGVLIAEPVSEQSFAEQLNAVSQFSIQAIKIGVLANTAQLVSVLKFIEVQSVPVVWDPVNISSSGNSLTKVALSQLKSALLPVVTLVTPNLSELFELTSEKNLNRAVLSLADDSCNAVFVKGGHGAGEQSEDFFFSRRQAFWLSSPRQETPHTRGTGCALATAITSAIALDYSLGDAIVIGKAAVNQGLRHSSALADDSKGCVRLKDFPCEQQDFPFLTFGDAKPTTQAFPDCGETPLGLYPIIDRSAWLERLLPLGVTTAQLRIKDLTGDDLVQEIKNAIEIARQFNCRLFINDHWALAIELGAYGVHLGQEDLHDANIAELKKAGLRLGVSTHCHYEVARALALKPSYIACGPVYPTTTKIMPWQPQGLAGLHYWKTALSGYPLVSVGGINKTRMPEVLTTGVSGIAMITAITEAANPEQECQELLASF